MKIAAIDIGSNSIHMIVVLCDRDGHWSIVDREKDMVKLGAGAFRRGELSDESFAAGVDSLAKFAKIVRRHRVSKTLVVATSAVREASNRHEFLAVVRKRTGLSPRVISGQEEARLVHLAVRERIDLSGGRALCLDIGGGSVEAIVGDATRMQHWSSLKLGVLRLRDLAGDEDRLTRERRRRIESYIREHAGDAIAAARKIGFEQCIGTSGTILNLGLAVHLHRGRERWISPHGRVVPLEELAGLTDELLELDASQRDRVPGVDPDRSDTIHLGGLLLVRLMEMARADGVTLCDGSIREGLVVDALARQGIVRGASGPGDLRRHSVTGLLRRCGQDGPHAHAVARLSLAVFDQTRSLHKLGDAERELLEFTALLHDVGRHIGYERHEQHSHYIIRHGDLLGFSAEQIDLMAIIARFHRKAKPKPRHREFAALPAATQRLVTLFSGILRLAEGLDRRHIQAVRSVRCELTGKKLRVAALSRQDAEVECWSARRKASLLARALDRRIEIISGRSRVRSVATT